jgi:cytochrome P450
MSQLRAATRFATQLYRQRAMTLYHGYLRGDPMARLELRPGRDNPYAIYEQLRAGGPLTPTRLGNWVSTSHPVCRSVLRDRRFGVRPPGATTGTAGLDLSFLEMNPPDHTRLRRLVQPPFSPRHLAGLAPRVERTVHQLLDAAPAGRTFDLVSTLAAPLPITVITDLLGIPDADAAAFARYGTLIGGALDGIRSLRHAARLQAADSELNALFLSLFELRRREPADDLVSRLVAAEGDRITPTELIPLCALLLVAGFETTVNAVGNAVNALLDHPDQWAALCADPAGVAPRAVEEALRYDPPVQRTGRFAMEPLTLAGRDFGPGQYVTTLIGAANRDPDVFPEPDRFDIFREPTGDHLAFSAGIHYCVGQPLAVLEITTALRCLAERMPGLRRAGEVRRRNASTIRGPIHLPVRAGSGRVSRRVAGAAAGG